MRIICVALLEVWAPPDDGFDRCTVSLDFQDHTAVDFFNALLKTSEFPQSLDHSEMAQDTPRNVQNILKHDWGTCAMWHDMRSSDVVATRTTAWRPKVPRTFT